MNRRSLLLLASFTLAACGAPPTMDASTDATANDSADELIAQPDSNAARDGSSYAAGSYAGTVNFGAAGSATSSGQTDAFALKIPQ
ncbi:MAG: hypothetical protein U0269_25305 [Polyangiales bacterium]